MFKKNIITLGIAALFSAFSSYAVTATNSYAAAAPASTKVSSELELDKRDVKSSTCGDSDCRTLVFKLPAASGKQVQENLVGPFDFLSIKEYEVQCSDNGQHSTFTVKVLDPVTGDEIQSAQTSNGSTIFGINHVDSKMTFALTRGIVSTGGKKGFTLRLLTNQITMPLAVTCTVKINYVRPIQP